MSKKYKFTGKEEIVFGVTLKQIVCVSAFASVCAGDVGGWIESKRNLDLLGNAWVSGNAWVYGDARVYGNAWVSGNAWVYGDARVYGDAQVSGNARVYGDARVSGSSKATKKVLTINSNYYHVTITDNHIAIGCEQKTIKQWRAASRNKLIKMDGERSADLWEKSKDFILMLTEDR